MVLIDRDGRGPRDRHSALLDELDRTGEDQISLTDPDARAMVRMTRVGIVRGCPFVWRA